MISRSPLLPKLILLVMLIAVFLAGFYLHKYTAPGSAKNQVTETLNKAATTAEKVGEEILKTVDDSSERRVEPEAVIVKGEILKELNHELRKRAAEWLGLRMKLTGKIKDDLKKIKSFIEPSLEREKEAVVVHSILRNTKVQDAGSYVGEVIVGNSGKTGTTQLVYRYKVDDSTVFPEYRYRTWKRIYGAWMLATNYEVLNRGAGPNFISYYEAEKRSASPEAVADIPGATSKIKGSYHWLLKAHGTRLQKERMELDKEKL